MALSLEFIGHSALVIELDGIRVLTDPATRARIGPLRRVVPVPSRRGLEGVDAVLVSHLHWDHLDMPSLRGLGFDVRLVVPRGAGTWLRSSGFTRVHEVDVGSVVDVGGVAVEAVPALHSGFRPPKGPTAEALGFVVRGSSRSVYFAGDTDLFDGMADVAVDVDVALLPVWGWGPVLGRGLHLDPRRAAEAARRIGPRFAVPIHWGTYWPHGAGLVMPKRLIEPPAAFAEYTAELAPDVRVALTDVGDTVPLRW